MKLSLLQELTKDEDLRAIGKAIKNGDKEEAVEPAQTEEPKVTAEPTVDAVPTVNVEPEKKVEFALDQKVKPLIGPHKGEIHTVVKVYPDGSIGIIPDGLPEDQVKYQKKGAKLKADQVELVPEEGLK